MHSAARSFGVYSGSYEKSRPGYSRHSVELITKKVSLTKNSKILELGAGTGKYTASLVHEGFSPIVTDWCPRMLSVLHDKYPHLKNIAADACHLPLQSGTFDVVIAAQAFHWFATKDALKEIKRVLKPRGYLFLIFQERVENSEWIKEFHNILYSYPYDVRARFELGTWKQAFTNQNYFSAIQHENFPYTQYIAREDLIHRALGMSFLTALPDCKRESAISRIQLLCNTHDELKEKDTVEFFYKTHVYWARSIL